jgi:integrase
MGKPLTVKQVLALKTRAQAYEVRDPALVGGYIVVHPSGATSYVLRFRFNGAKRKLTIGRFDAATGLAEVRAKAHAALADLAKARRDPSAVDPAAAKTQARREAAEARRAAKIEADRVRHDSVEHVVELFTKRHLVGLRTGAAVARVLEREVAARWRGRALGDISRADIHELLDEVADRAPIQANRVAAYLSKFFRWATTRGIIASNPIVGGVERPGKEKKRERALDDRELALVWKAAEGMGYPFGSIIQLLVLTGQRKGEIGEARWSEINLDEGVLDLPATRTKNKKPHRAPLSPQALTIIESLPRYAGCDLLFTTTRKTPVSGFSRVKRNLDKAVAELNGGEPISDFTLHDLRRSCAAGMQRLGVETRVIERALNHISGTLGGLVGTYQVHDFAKEKHEALRRWGSHVERIISGAAEEKVVPLRRERTP